MIDKKTIKGRKMFPMLTVQEVADLLHVHTNTVRRWSNSGKINSLRINVRGDRRYKQQDVELFLDSFNVKKRKRTRTKNKQTA